MTGLPICPFCQNSVSERRKSLKCDGMCKKTYHTSCIRWSSEEYQSYVTISNKVKWFCPSCVNSLERVFVKESVFDLTSNDSKNSLRDGERTDINKVCSFALDENLMNKAKSIDSFHWVNNEKGWFIDQYHKAKEKPKMEELHKKTFVKDIINQREMRSKPMTPRSLDFYQQSANVYNNDKSSTNQFQLTPPLWQYQKPIYSNCNDNNPQNSYTNDIIKMQSKPDKPNTSKTVDTNSTHIVNDVRHSEEIWKKSVNKLHALSFLSKGRKSKTKKPSTMERKLKKKEVGNPKEKELGLQHLTTDSGESLILHITYMRKKDKYKKSVSNPTLKKNKHMKERGIKIKDSKHGFHFDRDSPTNMKKEKIVKHISTDSGESFLLHTIKSNRQGDEFVESIEFLEEGELDKEQNPICTTIQDNTLLAVRNKKLSKQGNIGIKCVSPIMSVSSLEKASFSQTSLDRKQMKGNLEGNISKTNSSELLDASTIQNIPRTMNKAQMNPWGENFENVHTLFKQQQLNEMSLFSDRNIDLLKTYKEYTQKNHLSQDGNMFPSTNGEDIVEEIIENITNTLETIKQNERLKKEERESTNPIIEHAESTQSYITQFKCFNSNETSRCTTNEMRIINSALLTQTNPEESVHEQSNLDYRENNVENSKIEKNELNREISKGSRRNKSEELSLQHTPLEERKDITKSNPPIVTSKSSINNSESTSKRKDPSKKNKHKDKVENENKAHLNHNYNANRNAMINTKITDSLQNPTTSENICNKKSKTQNQPDLGYLESAIGIISNMLSHKMKKQDEETQVDLSEWTSFENALTQTCTFKIPCSTIAINTSCSMSLLKDEVCQCPELCLQENAGRTKIQELKNTFLKLEQFSRKNKSDLGKSQLDRAYKHTVTFSDTPNISKELKQHKVQEWLFTAKQDQLNKPKQVKPDNIFKITNRKTFLEKNKLMFEGPLVKQPLKEEAIAESSHVS